MITIGSSSNLKELPFLRFAVVAQKNLISMFMMIVGVAAVQKLKEISLPDDNQSCNRCSQMVHKIFKNSIRGSKKGSC